jgi:hypothetical protein
MVCLPANRIGPLPGKVYLHSRGLQYNIGGQNMCLTLITPVAALITVLITIILAITAIRQLHFHRFALGVQLVMKIDERFENEEFIMKRKTAATALKKLTKENEPDLEPFLDFFETLGFLTRYKALNKEFVWSTFFYWFYGYYRLCKSVIDQQRDKYHTRYEDLMWLKKVLIDFEKKKKGKLDESEWDNFLEEEAELTA